MPSPWRRLRGPRSPAPRRGGRDCASSACSVERQTGIPSSLSRSFCGCRCSYPCLSLVHKGSSYRYLCKGPYESLRGWCRLCRYDQSLYYRYGALQDLNWASSWILEDPGALISALYVVSWVSFWALAGPGMEGQRGQSL